MADINKTIEDLDEQIAWIQDNDFHKFPGWGHAVLTMKDALELLKEQNGLMLALEQANATINYLNEEKEKAIKEIEERKAFNLKCDGQPEWLRKGIDVGLNTALDILKGKDGEQE